MDLSKDLVSTVFQTGQISFDPFQLRLKKTKLKLEWQPFFRIYIFLIHEVGTGA